MNEIRFGSLHRVSVGVLLLVGLLAPAATAQIQWKSGASPEPPARTATELEAAVTSLANSSEARHWVVHFDQPVTPAQRRTLETAGLSVCGYLGNHSFFATVDPERCAVCVTCVRTCPYDAPHIGTEGHAVIDPAECRGCGACVAECPGKAIRLQHFTDEQIIAKTDALFQASL